MPFSPGADGFKGCNLSIWTSGTGEIISGWPRYTRTELRRMGLRIDTFEDFEQLQEERNDLIKRYEMKARKREPRKTFLSTKRIEMRILFLTEPEWVKGETDKSGDRLIASVKNLDDDQIYQLDQYEPIGNDLSVALVEVLGENVLGKAARLRGVVGMRNGKDGKQIEFLETVKVEPIVP